MEGANDHRRKPLRLASYDYSSPGAYFVTICVKGRRPLFGASGIAVGELGAVVSECWLELPSHYPSVTLDAFVVMPNHIHGIIWLGQSPQVPHVGAGLRRTPTERGDGARGGEARLGDPVTLFEVVRALKSFSARRINELLGTPGVPVWQRSYYERVVRGETELARLRRYIAGNPDRWASDPENPS